MLKMICTIVKLYICLYCWLLLKGLEPQKFVIKENTATDVSADVYASFLSQEQYKHNRAQNNSEVHKKKTQQPGDVYSTDLTKKKPEEPEANYHPHCWTLRFSYFLLDPLNVPLHSFLLIQQASLHKRCSVLPKSKS